MPTTPNRTAFETMTVVELSGDVAGEMTGKLFVTVGAKVIKLEGPEGSPTRRIGPYRSDVPDPNESLVFWHYNGGKESVVVDPGADDRDRRLVELLEAADVLIVSAPPWDVDIDALARQQPRLIIVVITGFGMSGPWADYRGSDVVHQALGGVTHLCGYDDHSLAPLRPGEHQAAQSAASMGYLHTLLALLDREAHGEGQVLDVSTHASVALNLELALPYWFYNRAIVQRQTGRHAQPGPTQPPTFRSGDDRHLYFAFHIAEQKQWTTLIEWMEERELAGTLSEPAFLQPEFRQKNAAVIQDMLEVFFLLHDAAYLFRDGQRRGLPIGVVQTPAEVLGDEHLNERLFFEEVIEHDGTAYRRPTAPFRFSAYPQAPQTPAPRLEVR